MHTAANQRPKSRRNIKFVGTKLLRYPSQHDSQLRVWQGEHPELYVNLPFHNTNFSCGLSKIHKATLSHRPASTRQSTSSKLAVVDPKRDLA